LKAVLLPKEVEEKSMKTAEKLRKILIQIDLQDHLWHLRSWDDNGVPMVKLYCGECKKDFGGNSGDYSKAAIHNLLNNFKKSHILYTLHVKAWCRRKGISFEDHPQTKSGKAVILTAADH
jgi:hypothetical protein